MPQVPTGPGKFQPPALKLEPASSCNAVSTDTRYREILNFREITIPTYIIKAKFLKHMKRLKGEKAYRVHQEEEGKRADEKPRALSPFYTVSLPAWLI